MGLCLGAQGEDTPAASSGDDVRVDGSGPSGRSGSTHALGRASRRQATVAGFAANRVEQQNVAVLNSAHPKCAALT